MKVANRKCIRRLGMRTLLAGRTEKPGGDSGDRPYGDAVHIVVHHRHVHQRGLPSSRTSGRRKISHGGFKYLTEEQFEELKGIR